MPRDSTSSDIDLNLPPTSPSPSELYYHYHATFSRLESHETRSSNEYYETTLTMGLDSYRELPDLDLRTLMDIEMEQPETINATRWTQPMLDLDLPSFPWHDNLDFSNGLGMLDMGGDLDYGPGAEGTEMDVEQDEEAGVSMYSADHPPNVFVPVPSLEDETHRVVHMTGSEADFQFYMNYIYSQDMIEMALNREEEILGELFEGEDVRKGKPPASEKVLEGLRVVVVSKEDIEKGNASCAVCKDEMNVGEKARELPCRHRYHNACIFPWLRIRNTCPVCRYELETDDPDYEKRRVAGGAN